MLESLEKKVLDQLHWRYAVKKFDPTKVINTDTWAVLEESLRLSASSYGLQPWQFFVVTTPEIKKKLMALSWNQSQVADCSHLVVMCYLNQVDEAYVDRFIESVAKTQDRSIESLQRYRDVIVGDVVNGARSKKVAQWASNQLYIAMGSFLTTAALLSVDVCPLEGIQPAGYELELGLAGTSYTVAAALAAGYRSSEDKYQFVKKVRFPSQEVIRYL